MSQETSSRSRALPPQGGSAIVETAVTQNRVPVTGGAHSMPLNPLYNDNRPSNNPAYVAVGASLTLPGRQMYSSVKIMATVTLPAFPDDESIQAAAQAAGNMAETFLYEESDRFKDFLPEEGRGRC